MQYTDEQTVTYDLAEKHPAMLNHLAPGEGVHYTCFFCGVGCSPYTFVPDLDVSDHSPDCVWRKARVAWQVREAAELQREQVELYLLKKVIAACGLDPCAHCENIQELVEAEGLGEELLK